jgi:UDP-N-acetyl-D-mannosaminuronate dehydrogenase
MIVGVIGLGDVGQAITKLCRQKHQVFGRDLTSDNLSGKKVDVLHICIPWDQKFEPIVLSAIHEFSPRLTIISSTVKPGTTQSIYKKSSAALVHAPVSGVHPHLYKYLKIFTKPLGAVNTQAFKLAKQHFTELGVKVVRFDSPFETELAKILSTTYYAWNILFEKWVHQLAGSQGANFDQVYKMWNQIYNAGYRETQPHVIRPVLVHSSGPIGGHCLIPNARILDDWLHDDFTKFILKQNRLAK